MKEGYMNAMRCLGTALALTSLLFSTGCDGEKGITSSLMSNVPIEDLQRAPQEIEIGDQEYVLETFLWRDFMPVSPPDGKGLIALIKVIEKNEAPIAPDLKLKYLWVINDRDVWFTAFTDETPPSPDDELHRMARDGPTWAPEVQVDVVVGMTMGNGPLKFLRASDQWIYRTD